MPFGEKNSDQSGFDHLTIASLSDTDISSIKSHVCVEEKVENDHCFGRSASHNPLESGTFWPLRKRRKSDNGMKAKPTKAESKKWIKSWRSSNSILEMNREDKPDEDEEDEISPEASGAWSIPSLWSNFPGMVLFSVWIVFYFLLIFLVHWISSRMTRSVTGDSDDAVIMEKTKFVKMQISFLFVICMLMDIGGICFQISKKKRALNSLVFFINTVSFVVYLSACFGWIPAIYSLDGKRVSVERYFQWMNTTPCMIFVLSALGNSLQKYLIHDVKELVKCVAWDEAMIFAGFSASFA